MEGVAWLCDNAHVNWAAYKLLWDDDRFKHNIFSRCAAHLCNIMLHKLSKRSWWKDMLAAAHLLVQLFRNVGWARFAAKVKTCGKDLVGPAATRFGTNLLMLNRLVEL